MDNCRNPTSWSGAGQPQVPGAAVPQGTLQPLLPPLTAPEMLRGLKDNKGGNQKKADFADPKTDVQSTGEPLSEPDGEATNGSILEANLGMERRS